ncbi:MAG: glycosyltransferase family 4 protein [Candidatus Micrarchaeales archaeon]|jgi:glycosyltransferase involved in cell wall biosynthesis
MKIAFAYDNAYPWFNGGIEKRRFLIMESLAKKGHEVHCFTMQREGMPGKEFRFKGINYHCCGVAMPVEKMYVHGRRNIKWPLKYALILPFKLAKYDDFEIIDADAFPFLHLFTIWLYAKLKGIKFAITWHEVWKKEYWQKYMGRSLGLIGYFVEYLSSKLTKHFISNSEQTAKELKELFGKESIVFPAAVSSYEVSAKEAKKKDQFIAIGRLIPEKRVDMVLRAIAGSKANAKIIGIGPEESNLKALAKDLHIEKKVKFIRRLSQKKLFKAIKESKGLLMFSAREGLSLITLEAMMLGVPVFIVGSTSLPKEVKELCFLLDEKNIGKSLDDALENYEKYQKKVKEIREIVRRRFSADYAEEVYKSILSKP